VVETVAQYKRPQKVTATGIAWERPRSLREHKITSSDRR
jgi:hypothetical protein